MHSSASTTEETRSVVRRLKKMSIAPQNNSLFCDICQVYVSSDIVMNTHIQGKRHIELEKLQKKQMSTATKSLYVRGYPSGSTSNQIAQFFTGFGKVDKIVLEKEHGYYAIVEFNDESTVKSILSLPLVVMNGSRLTIKSRQLKGLPPKRKTQPNEQNSARNDTNSSVDATGSNDLLERMKECSNMTEEMNFLTNELSLSSEDILQRHSVCREIENILRMNLFPVCSVHPFGSSVSGLGSKGCDLDIFLNLESDGTLNGLPFAAKDLLCDVPDFQNGPCTPSAAPPLPNGGVSGPDVGEVVDGSMDPAADQPVLQLVRKISDLLYTNSDVFSRVIHISNARCPVVKFIHVQSGLKCDLSINNRLALCNTVLLKCLLNSDDRIRPLIASVRHWAKLSEVAGQSNTGSKLTNYALTMVVVFYLQNISPPVLPPIQELSHLAEKPCMVDGWDCAFTTDLTKIPRTENHSTVEELLTGFFEFFVQFDFGHKIMSIRSGESIHLTSFSEQMASDSRLKGFKICPILIQDPFVLNHNIASNVNEKSRAAIQRPFLAAAHFIKDKSTSGQRPRLFQLLSSATEAEPERDSLGSELKARGEGAVSTGTKTTQTFTIKSDVTKMMEEVCRKEKTLGEIENTWCQNAVAIILETLRVFHTSYLSIERSPTQSNTQQGAKLSPVHDDTFGGNDVGGASLKNNKRCLPETDGCTSLKRAKGSSDEITTTDGDEDPNTTDASKHNEVTGRVFSARCSTNSRSWLGRKKLRAQLPHITDEREKELEISRLIDLEQNQREGERPERTAGALLAFDLSVSIDKIPETAVTISLEAVNKSGEQLRTLRCYFFPFRSVVEKLVDKYALQDIEKWNSPATPTSHPTAILDDD